MRAVDSDEYFLARSSEARIRRTFFLLTSTYIDVGHTDRPECNGDAVVLSALPTFTGQWERC